MQPIATSLVANINPWGTSLPRWGWDVLRQSEKRTMDLFSGQQDTTGHELDIWPSIAGKLIPAELQRGHPLAAESHPGFKDRRIHLLPQAAIAEALQADAVARKVMNKDARPSTGHMVGIRLNLNVYRSTGLCVHTVHRGGMNGGHRRGKGFWNGEVLHYAQTVVLRNAFFNVQQKGREMIASGQAAKHPIASIDGEVLLIDGICSMDGVEVAFNPKREHLFVDETGRALWYAEEVTIVAHRAYARGQLFFHSAATAPKRAGGSQSRAWF